MERIPKSKAPRSFLDTPLAWLLDALSTGVSVLRLLRAVGQSHSRKSQTIDFLVQNTERLGSVLRGSEPDVALRHFDSGLILSNSSILLVSLSITQKDE